LAASIFLIFARNCLMKFTQQNKIQHKGGQTC
jgi:hypothetical protein